MPTNTNRATLFSRDLSRQLCKLSQDGPLKGYCWKKNGHPEKWMRECADAKGTPKNNRCPIVFVEAELRRGNPESNVAKIWKWLEAHPPQNPVLLIQAFSKYYDSSSPQVHKETAIFLGQQMCKGREDIRYIHIDMDYQPGPGNTVKGAGRRTQHAYKLAEDVACEVRNELERLNLPNAEAPMAEAHNA